MHTYFPQYSATRPRQSQRSRGHLISTTTFGAHLLCKHKNGPVSTGSTLRFTPGRLTWIELPTVTCSRSFRSWAKPLRKTGSGLGRPRWVVPFKKLFAYWNRPDNSFPININVSTYHACAINYYLEILRDTDQLKISLQLNPLLIHTSRMPYTPITSRFWLLLCRCDQIEIYIKIDFPYPITSHNPYPGVRRQAWVERGSTVKEL